MSSDFWNSQHVKYAEAEWIKKPSLFVQSIAPLLHSTGELLDLGAGQGQDSRFLADKGFKVTAFDFAAQGLEYGKQEENSRVSYVEGDHSKPLPFPDSSFDVVYSHLALHYFGFEKTQEIFDEIYRVLKPGGTLAFLVNSVNDPEYAQGIEIEPDFHYQVGDIQKSYFSIPWTEGFTSKFERVLLDDKGETYKDRAIGTNNLIRFVGRKG